MNNNTQVSLPALNWFVHVLAEDVGHVEWVKMTPEEQAIYDRDHKHNTGHPYKVVQHPIPEGKDLVLEDSRKYTIKCDSEETRNLIIELAKCYVDLEKLNHTHIREGRAGTWIKVEDIPPHSSCMSSPDHLTGLVYSPELRYIGGVHMGGRSKGKWFVIINGREVKHKVTHFRYLPPGPVEDTVPYEKVKEEVDRLKKIVYEYWY